MKSVQFIFGIHNHQPVGNFDYVFEHAYRHSYLPFIELLEAYPSITMSIHFSGCLLEWIETAHPEFPDRIAALVERGNLEILSAGFYEPVLAVIPDHDKAGQIKKLNQYIRDRFNYEPETAWLTERVWEPHLPLVLKDAGIKYATIDDFHFLSSGKKQDELDGYYLTDEQGSQVGVFPISQRLRYAIPFQDPEKTIEILRQAVTPEGDRVIVMADDGEKFGVWPGTYDLCFRKKWLKRFFDALTENSHWIKMTTFSDYGRNHPPRGRTYLPTVSYFEMNEWTLPADRGSEFNTIVHDLDEKNMIETVRPFLRGGTWRNFQSLYEESNWMQKRMTRVSWRLEEARKAGALKGRQLQLAREDLWRSQCNCAYWHGIFGGLYLPHLRHAIYTHLLQAEKILNSVYSEKTGPVDFDHDGGKEARLFSKSLQVFAGQRGGMIREIDLLDFNFNLSNGMRRYREAYHSRLSDAGSDQNGVSIHDQVLVKEPGLEKLLVTDTYDRACLTDHFIPRGTTLKDLETCRVETTPFSKAFFDIEQNRDTVRLRHSGPVDGNAVTIIKECSIKAGQLDISISITNGGSKPLAGTYGSEWNFALLGGNTKDRFYEINGSRPTRSLMKSRGSHEGVERIAIVNEWDGFRAGLSFGDPVSIWRFPVFSVSMSEAGFEKVYQSSVIIPRFDLDLPPGATRDITFTFFLEHLKLKNQ